MGAPPHDDASRRRGDPGYAEAAPERPVEAAVAFGVAGYDPTDPWHATLCVETERVTAVLPLTPKTLDGLLGPLEEVNQAQRSAFGAGQAPGAHPPQAQAPEVAKQASEVGPSASAPLESERPKVMHRIARGARLITGSQAVYQAWHSSTRGRVVIIGCVVLFVLIGVILSLT